MASRLSVYLDQIHEGGTKITEAALKRSPDGFFTFGKRWEQCGILF